MCFQFQNKAARLKFKKMWFSAVSVLTSDPVYSFPKVTKISSLWDACYIE